MKMHKLRDAKKIAALREQADKVKALVPDETVDERGRFIEPSGEFFAALDELVAQYEPTTLPIARDEMATLTKGLETLRAEMAFADSDSPQAIRLGHMHASVFWSRFHAAMLALFRDPPSRASWALKTPAALVADKVPLTQVCRIWGFVKPGPLDTYGWGQGTEPDLDLLQQELAEPGSVCTPQYIDEQYRHFLVKAGHLLPGENVFV